MSGRRVVKSMALLAIITWYNDIRWYETTYNIGCNMYVQHWRPYTYHLGIFQYFYEVTHWNIPRLKLLKQKVFWVNILNGNGYILNWLEIYKLTIIKTWIGLSILLPLRLLLLLLLLSACIATITEYGNILFNNTGDLN